MGVDHYNTLGVTTTASAADLRAAYLKLARSNHPDKFEGVNRDQAELRMQQINEAWNVLGVAHKRVEYDATLPKEQKARTTPGSSSAHRGRNHFRAFDDEPVTAADFDLDATPIAGSRDLPQWVPFVPILLVGFGILSLGVGTMLGANGVFAVGLMSAGLGALCFLLLPLVVMSRAERDPDL